MTATGPNGATWYTLRYRSDFQPRVLPPGVPAWMSPALDGTLLYDEGRHVLELSPAAPDGDAQPPSGLAVDVSGEIYRSDPDRGLVLVRRCDGSTAPLVRERGALARPMGLALDRRGLLYAADSLAARVAVVDPEDGALAGVLVEGLQEPVDVAPAPGGLVYVADRKAGLVVAFNGRFERCFDFAPRDPQGLPAAPKPIAVMVDADGAVLVADAAHPRLLRFGPRGERLPDASLAERARALDGGDVALDALDKVYGKRVPRALCTGCRPCRPLDDVGERLAEVQRAIRLLSLQLAHAFAAQGTFVSIALDGGAPGTVWHKLELDLDLPEGTWFETQTVTSDDPGDLSDPNAPSLAWAPDPAVRSIVPDRLVLSPPGRYLRLRVRLGSDGTATPSIRSIRVIFPRLSYLALLPPVFRRDPDGAQFLERFLALFELVLTDVEQRYEDFSIELNPAAAPKDVLDWLAALIDLAFDPSWPIDRRRALVARAMELYRTRGTPAGIASYVEVYTGERPVILEDFLQRAEAPPVLGVAGSVLGAGTHLAAAGRAGADAAWLDRTAHRFEVVAFAAESCDEPALVKAIDRIVTVSKPAHTVHRLRLVRPGAPVGEARLGMDAVLGDREAPRLPLDGCPTPGNPAGEAILGRGATLGARRPWYAQRREPTLE